MAHENINKSPKKVAHNRPQTFFHVLARLPKPAQNWFSCHNYVPRHICSLICAWISGEYGGSTNSFSCLYIVLPKNKVQSYNELMIKIINTNLCELWSHEIIKKLTSKDNVGKLTTKKLSKINPQTHSKIQKFLSFSGNKYMNIPSIKVLQNLGF